MKQNKPTQNLNLILKLGINKTKLSMLVIITAVTIYKQFATNMINNNIIQ